MKRLSIKMKLTIWFASFFLVILVLTIGVLLAVGDSVIKTDNRGKLKRLVEENCTELEYLNKGDERDEDEGDHFVEYRDGFLEIDDDFCDYRDGMYIALYYKDELLYGEVPIKEHISKHTGEQKVYKVAADKEQYYVYDATVQGENLDGLWIRGVMGKNEGANVLQFILKVALIGLPWIAIFANLGGYFIAKRGLDPLEAISRQAEHITQGSDLSRKISIKNESRETKRLQDTMNGMLQRLEESFLAEKQFTADASHELRTPVAVIVAECEYAKSVDDKEEWRESIDTIAEQGKRMTALINDLLTFTRLEQGTITLNTETLSLNEVVQGVCEEQKKIWENKNITLLLQCQENCQVTLDRGLLIRLITNLVENAFKYGKNGGNVFVEISSQDSRPVLSIRDDGMGIPEEELGKIWNRFYRGDNARVYENSTGLGLSMVKQIVELFHAEIKVFSEIKKGTTFLIYF